MNPLHAERITKPKTGAHWPKASDNCEKQCVFLANVGRYPWAAAELILQWESVSPRTLIGNTRRFVAAIVLTSCALILPDHAKAQFVQQGPKLVGTGAAGAASQGNSVSVSADGNTAIIGGNSDDGGAGAAWIWTRNGGVWIQQGTKLVGVGAGANAAQGTSVSISADGNTAIIGGRGDDDSAGAAWIWTRVNGTWTQQGTKLVGSGALGPAGQGSAVALSADGNTAIVGGILDNNLAGAAWVWTRTGGVWTQQGAKLVGSGAVGSAYQGQAVALSDDGNTAIVGGLFDNGGVGAAWIWTRAAGIWSQQGTKLVGSDTSGNAWQGRSVDLSADGNTALVGGEKDNNLAGATWVWTRSSAIWTQQGSKLLCSDATGTPEQGSSVSLSADGNKAVIGGIGDGGQTGATWVWARSAGQWSQQGPKLVGTGAGGLAVQGWAVSLSGDGTTAIVGGPSDAGSTGAVWAFTAGVVPPTPTLGSVSPSSGPTAGGTAFTITGTNFATGATVSVGGAPATVLEVLATTINAITPPHALGVVDVVVHNPDAQVGTLMGGFTYSDSPAVQTPPVRSDLPEDPGMWPTPSGKAVVITHGWKDTAGSWVKEMAEKICTDRGAGMVLVAPISDYATKACQAGGWDVWVMDWRTKAAFQWTPPGAYVNARGRGQNLAANFSGKNYSHVHFIAHSAGSKLIESATVSLKETATTEHPIAIHATFLDAYHPAPQFSKYGDRADWADNYVDTRPVVGPFESLDGTKLILRNSYNVNVTQTTEPDPCEQLSWLPAVSSCRHNRPYRFYGISVDPLFLGDAPSAGIDPILANGTGAMGYSLSVEKGQALGTLNTLFPKGGRCVMNSAGVCTPASFLSDVWTFLSGGVSGTVIDAAIGTVAYVAGIGPTLFTSLWLGPIPLQPQARRSTDTPASAAPTDTPSWITVLTTTTQPVNTLRFGWRFETAGEGYLRVFVDDVLVSEIDQRHVPLASLTSEEIYITAGAGDLPAGMHRIAFRLDGFGATASGIELTGVELGFSSNMPAATLANVSPTCASTIGGRSITISGSGFLPGAAVKLAGTPAIVTNVTPSAITVTTGARAPSVATTGAVEVTNPGAPPVSLPGSFTYAVRGDANSNGALTAADTFFLNMQIFLGGAASASPCQADANGNGAVSGADAFFLNLYVFLGGAPPPP